MNKTKRILAVFAAMLMLLPFGVNAFAMTGGGAEKSDEYTVGVDLSVFNIGGKSVLNYDSVDFAKMKEAGCDFAILRIGFTGKSTGEHTLDLAFIEYYNRARAAGMKLGLYFYPLATTYEQAADDANWVISVIEENNMYFEYPIYFDVEEGVHYGMNSENLTKLCLGWAETMEKAGYFPGIYGRDSILDKLSDDFKSKYDCWVRYIKSDSATAAQYSPDTTNVSDRASLWQYTMFQRFDGCTVKYTDNQLDGNISYKDYAKIMIENGYNNCDNIPEPQPESESVSSEEIAESSEENENDNEDEGIPKLGIVGIVLAAIGLIGLVVIILLKHKK